jgi:hypothetical protein
MEMPLNTPGRSPRDQLDEEARYLTKAARAMFVRDEVQNRSMKFASLNTAFAPAVAATWRPPPA